MSSPEQSGGDLPREHADQELVRRAQAGDRHAFDRLVLRHGEFVLSLAMRILGHRAEAEDAAQEVFLRMFRAIDRVDPARPLTPWLARVALNVARSHRRRHPGRKETALPENNAPRARGSSPEEHIQGLDRRAALRAAIEILTHRQREAFILRDLQGMPADTVAQTLGISVITVRRLSTEARRRILAWMRSERPELLP